MRPTNTDEVGRFLHDVAVRMLRHAGVRLLPLVVEHDYDKFREEVFDRYSELTEPGKRPPQGAYPKRRLATRMWTAMGGRPHPTHRIDMAALSSAWVLGDTHNMLPSTTPELRDLLVMRFAKPNPADWPKPPTKATKPTPPTETKGNPMNDKYNPSASCASAIGAMPGSPLGTDALTGKPIQHLTLVFGRNLADLSEDALVNLTEHIEADIVRFQKLATKSKFLTQRVADLKAALKAVTEELDRRV